MTEKSWRLLVVFMVTLALGLVFVVPVFASEVISEEDIVIDEDIDDDVYAFGATVTVNATIDGDLVASGGVITINGTVTGDVLAMAQTVIINGTIEDDLRAGAAVVLLADGASVGDDMNAGAMAVEMEPGSSVGGSLYFGAYQGVLNDVAGDVGGGAEGVQINGLIGGDAELGIGAGGEPPFNPLQFFQDPALPEVSDVASGITFGNDGEIAGDLTYSSTTEHNIPSGSVAGNVDFQLEVQDSPESGSPSGFSGIFGPLSGLRRIGFFVGTFAMLLVLGVLFQRFAPDFLNGSSKTLQTRILPSLGAGCLGYIAVFFIVIVGLILAVVLGLALGAIGASRPISGALGLFVNTMYVAFRLVTWWLPPILVALPLGMLIYRQFDQEGEANFWPLAIGLAIVAIVVSMPFVGGLARMLLSLFGFGAVILYLWPRKDEDEEDEAKTIRITGPEADKAVE
jgi:hypothetical protein